MKKIVLSSLLLSPLVLLASGDAGSTSTDIIPRTVNFLIFFAIMYYLIADHLKKMFTDRTASVASELEKVQEKVKESKKAKELAEAKLEEAKRVASDIITTAKKEALLIKDRYNQQIEDELTVLNKQYQERITLEKKKVIRESVDGVLKTLFKDGSFEMNDKDYVNIIMKKVV